MCGTFLLHWTPYAPLWLSVVAAHVAKTAGCVNLVVYFLIIQRHREEAIDMLSSMFNIQTQQAISEDISLKNTTEKNE